MEANWFTVATTIGGLIGTFVIAIATVFLWRVTRNLARETQRMAEITSRPHVVATIEPNRWSMVHADLNVDNTGNATAYDIQVLFEPPLPRDEKDNERIVPFQQVSVLKPGHGVSSYLSKFAPLLGKTYSVTVSWRRDPSANERETNTYTLSMSDLDGVTRLGALDPLTQIAQEIKKMREDWRWVAHGSKKVRADVFTSTDRKREQDEMEKFWNEQDSLDEKG